MPALNAPHPSVPDPPRRLPDRRPRSWAGSAARLLTLSVVLSGSVGIPGGSLALPAPLRAQQALGIDLPVEAFTLDNGMRFLVLERSAAPTVAT